MKKKYKKVSIVKAASPELELYVEAKKTTAVITTSETRPYGCFIFTKGVLKPDGTVWIV